MLAPDPALAALRPAASPREAARAAEPERRGEGDFGAVLEDQCKGAAPEAVEAAALPVLDAAPPVPDAALAPAVLPAAAAAPPVAVPAPSEVAALAIPAAAAPVTPSTVPAAIAPAHRPPAPRAVEGVPVESAEPAAEGVPTALPVRGAAPTAAPASSAALPAVEAERPKEAAAPPAPPAAETPRREVVAVEVPVRDAAGEAATPVPAPPEGDGGLQGLALRGAAAPPGWQLTADAGPPLPARAEAAPVQAAVQAMPAFSPQAAAGQMAVAIGSAPEEDTLEIRLDPPELGRVQIHLTRQDGAVQAMVLADRPETQDLLRRHADVLARELEQAGYEGVSLDFGGGEARPGSDEARRLDWAQAAPAQPAPPEAAAPAAPPRRIAAGALDIRL